MPFVRKLASSPGKVLLSGLSAFVVFSALFWGFVLFNTSAHATTPAEQGQSIFELKCKGCHTIGGGRLVGPDLKGVSTIRDTDWLVHFISTPDKLIAQNDPIAQPMVQQYGLPMPNLGLTEDEARAVLVYIDAQSAGTIATPAPTPTQTTTLSPTVAPTSVNIGATAEKGRAIFEQKCNSCHTIGGGGLVGPDLRGVTTRRDTEWLVDFITTPDKLIAQGDPIAQPMVQQYGLPMPNMGLSNYDAQAILAYIDAESAITKAAPVPSVATTAPISINAATGKDLFTGRLALTNNGPACLSCHNVRAVGLLGGGTVGKDLTAVYSKFGEAGITGILKATPFPMMKEIYTAKPLTSEEIGSVLAFLKESASAPSAAPQNPFLFFIIGGAVAVLIIGLFQWLWRGRLSGVRRPLVKGGSK